MDITLICNTPDDVLRKQVLQNSRRPLKWVYTVPEHDGHAVIVGGGPSIQDYMGSIRWRKSLGQKVFALNNAAKHLHEAEIVPDYQVMIDARPGNVKYVGYAKKYLLASQCHPLVFEAAPEEHTMLWHPVIEGVLDAQNPLPMGLVQQSHTLIGGGTTVGLSAMCLAYTMGYRKLHLYGYDSSHRGESGHAYPQPDNSSEVMCRVTSFGKVYHSTLTMAKQAELFPTVANNLIERGCIITMDGDGLLPDAFRHLWAPAVQLEEYEGEEHA
jgi:uncharacterized Rossmann fold enzyme